jgi:hypothetical protein
MDEIFCIDNFFSNNEMSQIEASVSLREPGEDSVVPHGPFANKLISNYIILKEDKALVSLLTDKISKVLFTKFNIISLTRVKLFLPWDIHSDYYINECQNSYLPHYNFLVPLDDVDSRTVIFNQTTDNDPNFYSYKQHNRPVDNPVSKEFWNEKSKLN